MSLDLICSRGKLSCKKERAKSEKPHDPPKTVVYQMRKSLTKGYSVRSGSSKGGGTSMLAARAQRSTYDEGKEKPMVGSACAKIRSTTLTLMAFPNMPPRVQELTPCRPEKS